MVEFKDSDTPSQPHQQSSEKETSELLANDVAALERAYQRRCYIRYCQHARRFSMMGSSSKQPLT
jgi:hypothetical protein